MKGEKFNKNIENKKEFIKKEEVLKTETFEKK